MDLLERIWDAVTGFFSALLHGVERGVTSVFGSYNARYIKKLQSRVDAINGLESKYESMSNEELASQTERFRERLDNGETLDDILVEAFAVCREAGKRYLDMRHYDVQMIGGMVLHSGAISEMVTGEGKTLVATLPAYLNALEGKGVHVVTVNDYLARRDMEWMAPLYIGLGLTVGAIQNDMNVSSRQKAYACDITYGTNNEFGFDYLRDNMRPAARGDDDFAKGMQQSQGPLHFAIIDEVDNILIDEARTPLIISGPAHENVRKYADADRIARQLKKDVHFVVNEKDHSANLTDDGVRAAEKLAGVESFYTAGNMEWPHLLDNSLKAHHLYKRDVNYVIKEGRIVIVDEFTGRLMEGRQWSDGLHQAVEAKEGVQIKEETQTLATITLQNFFKLYDKICGMTGTAMTEASEFGKIYGLDVLQIPTNRVMKRIEYPDVIYMTEQEKFGAVAEEIERLNKWDVLEMKDGSEIWGKVTHEVESEVEMIPQDSNTKQKFPRSEIDYVQLKGRPILIGTVSIEKSERLSGLLDRRGVKHEVLNAKHHKREAEIVAQAGRKGAVTIATNMAGRGTDIVLGGNPDTMAWARLQDTYATRLDVPQEEWDALVAQIERDEQMVEIGEEVKQIGGLHVIGTERHESRRIDLQLRGRCGRQGDPGSSRFFLSLEDDLMRIFAGQWVRSVLDKLGMKEGERIESRMVTRRIEAAQKKVEERHFEARKSLLEYDEVMDEQRKRVYRFRQNILDGGNCRDRIGDMIGRQIHKHLHEFLNPRYGLEMFATYAGNTLATPFEAKDFRGMDYRAAEELAKEEAERMAETTIQGKLDENLPEEEDPSDWNWDALAKYCNATWNLNLRDRDLKRLGREGVAEFLIEEAHASIRNTDLQEGEPFLDEDFGLKTTVRWVKYKFDLELDPEEIRSMDLDQLESHVLELARRTYDEREAEYPVMAGLYRFSVNAEGGTRIDREGLVNWARQRFQSDLEMDDLKSKQREEVRAVLIDHSRKAQARSREVLSQLQTKLAAVFEDAAPEDTVGSLSGAEESLQSIVDWLQDSCDVDVPEIDFEKLNASSVERKLAIAVENRFRPEMRRMERQLLLQIVDTAWKDHLLVMDHLRSSIGLAGYAQMDPKVEYKREGMQLFDHMWDSVGERTTDLIFRMEQLDEGFVGSTWVETSATHAEAERVTGEAAPSNEHLDAANQQQGEVRIDPIRNKGQKVGRNEPCPCNSGKKYKNCCMRRGVNV